MFNKHTLFVFVCMCTLLAGCSGGVPYPKPSITSEAVSASASATVVVTMSQATSTPQTDQPIYDEDIPLAPVSKDGKSWQYVDSKGNVVLDLPDYQDAKPFFGGRAIVLKDGKYSFIDKKGQAVGTLELDCVEIGSFSQGMACFSVKNDDPMYPYRYGFMDGTGKVVIEPIFLLPIVYQGEFARVFLPQKMLDPKSGDDNLAGFDCNAKYYMDRQGQIYEMNDNFGNRIWSDLSCCVLQELLAADEFGNRVAYMDLTSGKFMWKYDKGFIWQQEKKYVYKNALNEIVIGQQFEQAGEFIGGLAPVKEKGKQWGFIDTSGNYTIQPQFDEATRFSQGLAAVSTGDKWGYVDTTGQFVLQPQYVSASAFSEGLAVVCTGNNKCGFIDKTGKFVIQPEFDGAEGFLNGVAPVMKNGAGWGLIDRKGHFIHPLKPSKSFEPYLDFKEYAGYFTGSSYPNNEGIRVVHYSYSEKTDVSNICFIDGNGAVFIKPHKWYQATNFSGKGLAGVNIYDRNGKYGDYGVWGIIDKTGAYIVKPSLTEDEMLMRVFGYDTKDTANKELEQLNFAAASGETLPPLEGSLADIDCRKLHIYLLAGQKLPPLADTPAGLGEPAQGFTLYQEGGLYGFKNASDGTVAIPAGYRKASLFGR